VGLVVLRDQSLVRGNIKHFRKILLVRLVNRLKRVVVANILPDLVVTKLETVEVGVLKVIKNYVVT
jgi:hypothetical protein